MPAGGQRRRVLMAARRNRQDRGRWLVVLLGWRGWPGLAVLLRRWAGLGRRGRVIAAGGTAAGLVAVVVVIAVVVSGPQPRARRYLAFTACLLTDGRGLAGARVAPVWAGMQDASLATHAKVEYLPVTTGSTVGAAAPFVASLVARQCKVVVAAGPAQVGAVLAAAGRYPQVRFAVVGGAGGKPGGRNVTVVGGPPGSVRSAVDGLVTSAVRASG